MTNADASEGKKQPDLHAYFVQNGFWTKIGAAWKHGKGEGYSVRFDLLPNAPGDIVLRAPKAKDAASGETVEDEIAF